VDVTGPSARERGRGGSRLVEGTRSGAIAGGAERDSREVARFAARAAVSKQGTEIVILDVRELITITDYFVIVSGSSERQVATIADEVVHRLRDRGIRPARREGDSGARWLLLDYVDFVVHVFHDEEREYYRLERLWRDAEQVAWDEEPRAEVSSG
jgi:ribosome-associated protein